MNKNHVCLSLLFVLCTALPAHAGISAYAAYWKTQDLGDTAGVGAGFRSGGETFAWEVRGAYFPDVTESFENLIDRDYEVPLPDLEVSAIPIDLGVLFQFGDRGGVDPYIGAGGTYFLLDSNLGDVSDEVGFYGVAGVEVGGSSLSFLIEAMYRTVEGTLSTDPGDFAEILNIDIDDDIALDLGGIGIHAGIVWRF